MPLVNFDSELDQARANGAQVRVTQTIPVVAETVTVTPNPNVTTAREVRTTDVGRDPAEWSWDDLRNYVVRSIESRFGEFPKDPAKIAGIFKGFHRRHGAMAGPIAVAAFELFGGRWKGAPISVNRFCAGSDPYFAEPIKDRLTT